MAVKNGIIFFAVLVALCAPLMAQDSDVQDPVRWTLSSVSEQQKPGDKFTVRLRADIADGWHLYSVTQPPGGPTATQITLPGGQPFLLSGTVKGPRPENVFDENFSMNTEFYEEKAEFLVPLQVRPEAASGKNNLTLEVLFQACNDRRCTIPTRQKFESTIMIAAAVMRSGNSVAQPLTAVGMETPTAPASAAPDVPNSKGSAETKPPVAIPSGERSPSASAVSLRQQSFGSFLILAAAMGGLSLLTPCVFPMIPITVSYFTHHASRGRRSAVITSFIYAIGIILTFTALGMLLAIIFGAGGVNQLAANPWVNLLMTAIFLGFAFSLLGTFFIQVPSGLMNKLDATTRSKEGSRVVGALLMGFTFTLTSFTCTAPFVGTLLVMTTQGSWRWPLAGMLVFSMVFAIPFFILALAPQLMSQLPRAGGWTNSVKVVMGFLEIAAAMKFLSNADLVWHWGIFTRQAVLAVWVGTGILIVLYVLGYFRMAHDAPVESIGVARLTVAIVSLALTIWLIPGLFGRQLGELEPFLPPDFDSSLTRNSLISTSSASVHDEVGWILNDFEGALAKAKLENKPLFIDFTGYTCTNCRWMESNMFPRSAVGREMDKFVRVRLYTDGTGEVFQAQQKLLQKKFGTVALPYYAILRPDGSPIGTFPGLTRNADEFIAFLRKGSDGIRL